MSKHSVKKEPELSLTGLYIAVIVYQLSSLLLDKDQKAKTRKQRIKKRD